MSASAPTPAIFLSYARDDAAAARRLAEALRSSGLEVWFDENELRGGDTWDAKIRQQINDCALFLAVISQHTDSRAKGYFRLEWKLAVEQTHLHAEGVPFLAPVVIDDTRETGAVVPAEFLRVQWMRLPGALPTPQFVAQIKRLLEIPHHASATRPASPVAAPATAPAPPSKSPLFAIGVVAAIAIGTAVFFALRPGAKEKVPPAETKSAAPSPIAPNPAPARSPEASAKSIAVLPFANLSTEKENEFFADGLQDDVITSLAKIRDLTVISRTSTLAYRDSASRNLKKIAADLGVATVLEGSVRRVGSKVHMNAQLIDARTDAHLWADTFDGDAGDIFALQANLAQSIAAALKATLTGSERALIERRPTQSQEAYDLYLRAKSIEDALTPRSGIAKFEQAAALYTQATVRDPAFALAYERLTYLHAIMYWFGGMDPTPARRARAQAALEAVERLSTDAPETHIARGNVAYFCDNNWKLSLAEYRAAEVALPNDARLQSLIGFAHRRLGHWGEAVGHLQRTMELNPSEFYVGTQLAAFLADLRRFDAARELARRLLAIVPADSYVLNVLAKAQLALDGDRAAFQRAIADLPLADDDLTGLQATYRHAMLTGDLDAADRAMADPRRTGIVALGGVLVEPAALHRALIARLRGQDENAQRFADEAIAWAQHGNFVPRQKPYVALVVARAKAFAGRSAEAVPELQAATELALKLDAYNGLSAMVEAGRAYVALEHREEAFAILRTLMTGPSGGLSPNEIRIDPLWSRLKNDPRFEEILKSAKPL